MQKIECKNHDLELYLLSAGEYYSDAGAAMGVLPRKLWDKKISLDSDFCMKFQLNSLLVKTKDYNLLVDAGIGTVLTDKQKKIYKPSNYTLIDEINSVGLSKEDIDYVVLTHLHFDHAGGILSDEESLSFSNAEFIIQSSELEIALFPDSLNLAAYPLHQHYQVLKNYPKLNLLDGDYQIAPFINIKKVQGHSNGMQILEIKTDNEYFCFAGDVFPTVFHLNPAVTSAYEVDRTHLVNVKRYIIDKLNQTKGTLILGHEIEKSIIKFPIVSNF